MGRLPLPDKKDALLEQCLAAIMKRGSLALSLQKLSRLVGTSGRMMVYHFGSKREMERQIIRILGERLREKMLSFQDASLKKDVNPAKALLKMWSYYTSSEMRGIRKLCLELNMRTLEGDKEAQKMMEQENAKWMEIFGKLFKSKDVALALHCLIQGAVMDFLSTGNAVRGRTALQTFLKVLDLKK